MVEEISAAPKSNLLAFRRPAFPGIRRSARHESRIYISAGIHGDEPAGPLAIRQLLEEDQWPAEASLWVLPCLNPTGFAVNRRENAEGMDLNRQYLQPKAKETLAHIDWLKRQHNFDLCFCLHEDWEAQGFYVYELNPDGQPSLAEQIVARVSEVCPIDTSEIIEGRPANRAIRVLLLRTRSAMGKTIRSSLSKCLREATTIPNNKARACLSCFVFWMSSRLCSICSCSW